MCDIHEKLHARVYEMEKLYSQLQGQLIERAEQCDSLLRELITAKQELAVASMRLKDLQELLQKPKYVAAPSIAGIE